VAGWNEGIDPAQLDARERRDSRRRDDQEAGNADSDCPLLPGRGRIGNN
jgi:hypothetical protein